MTTTRFSMPARLLLPFGLVLLSACGGGGSSSNDSPIANAGPDIRARFGSEITLSGRDSYDKDGPILNFSWAQLSGPSAELAVVSPSAVKLTVPSAAEDTDLVFELTVEDNGGKTATDRVTVSAVGPVDLNRFLTYFSAPDDYVVEVALDPGVGALTADVSFDLVMNVTQRYQTQNGTTATRLLATETHAGTWTATQQSNNTYPRFSFDIPSARIEDLTDVNKAARNAIEVIIAFELQNVTSAVDYVIQVLDNEGEPIALNDIAPVMPLGLNAPTPNGISVDTSLLLDHLGYTLAESKTTALAYYAAIDPDNEKTTLSDWLTANGYDESKATRAQYLNGFDLAFGRDMRMWSNDQGHVFAFVENYPNVDAMVDGSSHFGTVAMEYSPGPSGGEPFTKFYTFIRDPLGGEQKRVISMDFDGRGEKFTPGNCAVCHGGTPAALVNGEYPNEGNIGAGFLLWDVDTFAFSDAAYEARTPFDNENFLNRSDYEAAFKVFNNMVKLTNITDAQRDLVHGWYGGESMPNTVFDGSYIPEAWRSPADGGPDTNPENASEFYLEVFAPTCRACHNGLDNSDLQFASYADFIARREAIIQRVFTEGTMPMARVTMDNFWVGTQTEVEAGSPTRAQLLAEHLALNLETQTPGSPVAIIASNAVGDSSSPLPDSTEQTQYLVGREDRIELSALPSLFAATWKWTLTPPSGSLAALSQTQQPTSAFVTDAAGDYLVTLMIANASGDKNSVSYTYQVQNQIPVAGNFEASVKQGGSVDINLFGGDTQIGDGEVEDHTVSLSNIQGGNVVETGGVVTFTATSVGLAGFDFVVADIDADPSNSGSVSVEITELPSPANDIVAATVGTLSDPRYTTVDALANDTLGTEPTSVISIERVSGALNNGLNDCATAQGSLSFDNNTGLFDYTPPVACAGSEVWRYKLSDFNGDISSFATITINVNRSAAGAFSKVNDVINNPSYACASCHDDFHVMDLNGTALERWQDITECNRNAPDTGTDCNKYGDRINLTSPAESLLLQKPLGNFQHTIEDPNSDASGYQVFTGGVDDQGYKDILNWIEEGAASP